MRKNVNFEGPLPFIIYIKDFCKFLSFLNAIHFIDDTYLYNETDPLFDTMNLINKKLT